MVPHRASSVNVFTIRVEFDAEVLPVENERVERSLGIRTSKPYRSSYKLEIVSENWTAETGEINAQERIRRWNVGGIEDSS
jgi:hypothetical protein